MKKIKFEPCVLCGKQPVERQDNSGNHYIECIHKSRDVGDCWTGGDTMEIARLLWKHVMGSAHRRILKKQKK